MDWDTLLKCLIAGVVAIAICWAPVSCSKHTDDKIAEAIANGVDPTDARCAYKGDGNNVNTCAIRAAQRGMSK